MRGNGVLRLEGRFLGHMWETREVFILSLRTRMDFFSQLIPILAAQLWVFSHPLAAFTDLHSHTEVRQSA